jgi:UDP-glucose:(glucosyl)LPS alpha-1,2-glucosyltransferase
MLSPCGGTELAKSWLYAHADKELLAQVNVVSRPDDYKEGEKNILWIHDLPNDMPFLANKRARTMFDGIVFVSSWQQTVFFMNLGVAYSESTVIRNAIRPITVSKERASRDKQIRLIYHPTPHRGLELLVPAFIELCKTYDNLHLDVYSNFDIYARPEANKAYEPVYKTCREHPNIAYHGSQPNDVVRQALSNADIFAYPCIWRETSCISAMEAMSAKCLIVAPDYCALPETIANFGESYSWTEQADQHIARFSAALERAISRIGSVEVEKHLDEQKQYADRYYNWDFRVLEWNRYLAEIVEAPKKKMSGLTWN